MVPRVFTAKVRSHSASSACSSGRFGAIPCAFTRTSTGPRTLVRVCSAASTSAPRETSTLRPIAWAPNLRSMGAQAIGLSVDVSRGAEVDAALQTLTSVLGPVDVLVNAHGIAPNRPLLQADEAEWDRTFAVNTRGTMLTCRAVGNQMIDRGSRGAIVNVSSGAATSARLGAAGYSGSKAAINMLTEALAIELGPHGIRVNAVAPGLVTDNPLRATDPNLTPYMRMMLDMTPLGRTGAPADIARS